MDEGDDLPIGEGDRDAAIGLCNRHHRKLVEIDRTAWFTTAPFDLATTCVSLGVVAP